MVEGSRLIFSRWQIQALACDRLTVDDAATAIGLSISTRCPVVVIIGPRRVAANARSYQRDINCACGRRLAIITRRAIEDGSAAVFAELELQCPAVVARRRGAREHAA